MTQAPGQGLGGEGVAEVGGKQTGGAGEVRVGGVNSCHVMSSRAGSAPHSPGPPLRSFLPCCHSVPLYSTDGILLVSFKPAAPAQAQATEESLQRSVSAPISFFTRVRPIK